MMRVKQYAVDMRSGKWRLNGEAIKKSTTGRLLDGQNRLLACIEADTPFLTLVVRGLDDVVDQMTMDTGSSRSYSDVLKMRGETNCTALASAVRGVTLWNMGMRRFSDGGGGAVGAGAAVAAVGLSNATLDATLNSTPVLRDVAQTLKRMGRNLGIPTQISGALWVAFHAIDADDAQHFFQRLESDEGHRDGDPIFALRRLLLNNRRHVGGHARRTFILAWIIKAWNFYREGAEVKHIVYSPGGSIPRSFRSRDDRHLRLALRQPLDHLSPTDDAPGWEDERW